MKRINSIESLLCCFALDKSPRAIVEKYDISSEHGTCQLKMNHEGKVR